MLKKTRDNSITTIENSNEQDNIIQNSNDMIIVNVKQFNVSYVEFHAFFILIPANDYSSFFTYRL